MKWRETKSVEWMDHYLMKLGKDDSFLRLFAVRCAEHVAFLVPEPEIGDALQCALRFAEGRAETSELRSAYLSAIRVASRLEDSGNATNYHAALSASWTVVDPEYAQTSYVASHAAYYAYLAGGDDELEYQQRLLASDLESD